MGSTVCVRGDTGEKRERKKRKPLRRHISSGRGGVMKRDRRGTPTRVTTITGIGERGGRRAQRVEGPLSVMSVKFYSRVGMVRSTVYMPEE
jgi:hypothetical protein